MADPERAVTLSILASVWVLWTAPGDDGMSGRAARYELRRSTAAPGVDTLAWWEAATPVPGLPAPSLAGSTDSVRVTGLARETAYFFILRTADEVPNWSGFSNVVPVWLRTPEAILIKP